MTRSPSLERPPVRPLRRAILAAALSLAAAGCNGGLPATDNLMPATDNSTATGALNGKFTSTASAIYNTKAQKGLTRFRLDAPRTPSLKTAEGVGMTGFILGATLSGPPAVKTYGFESQIFAEFDLDDGSVFDGGVNSQLHLYLMKIGDPVAQSDGSASYEVHGKAEGICKSASGGVDVGVINFTINF